MSEQTLQQIFRTIADRLGNPMPDWAFCNDCGMLLINVPGVRQMASDRIGENRVAEAPVCHCDAQKQIDTRRLYLRSNVPHQLNDDRQRTLENFVSREGTDAALAAATTFLTGGPRLLAITGATGTGKSHLAEAVCRDFLSRGIFARYEYVPHLLDSMRGTDGAQVEQIMAGAAEAKVLVLDDLGTEKGSDWTNERLTSIVEQRNTRGAKTLITTNLTRALLAEKGYERLASRMWATGTNEAAVAVLTCTDARLRSTP